MKRISATLGAAVSAKAVVICGLTHGEPDEAAGAGSVRRGRTLTVQEQVPTRPNVKGALPSTLGDRFCRRRTRR
jgi:hypothetical protein